MYFVPLGISIVYFTCFIITLPIYVTMLYSFVKYRHKLPFNTMFFKLFFSLGVLDLIFITFDWSYNMLQHVIFDKVILYQDVMAKIWSLTSFNCNLGQVFGVSLVAVTRCITIVKNHTFTTKQTIFIISLQWIVPFIIVVPQLTLEFGYHSHNDTHEVSFYFKDEMAQYGYYVFCAIFNTSISVTGAVCYTWAFCKIYTARKNSAATGNQGSQEAKLAVVGFCLLLIVVCWAILTGFAVNAPPESFVFLTSIEYILKTAMSCINPYLILFCSKAARVHFLAVITRRSPEEIENVGKNKVVPRNKRVIPAPKKPENENVEEGRLENGMNRS